MNGTELRAQQKENKQGWAVVQCHLAHSDPAQIPGFNAQHTPVIIALRGWGLEGLPRPRGEFELEDKSFPF